MTAKVCTAGYEWVHGRKPRGSGAWAFYFEDAKDAEPVFGPWFHSYAKAKEWAVREAAKRGSTVVKVAP